MKIAFVLQNTYNSGGMERMLATIANALADTYEVSVISAFNEGRADYFSLAVNIRRVDLGLSEHGYLRPQLQKRAYREALAQELFANRQDVTISLGSLEFYFLTNIKDGSKKIFWFHFALNYDILTCRATPFGCLNRLIGEVYVRRRIYIAGRYDKVFVLSEEDGKRWQKYCGNVSYIYNPVTVEPVAEPDYSAKRAIVVGRLDRQKGFDFLIEAWCMVHKQMPDWHLDIYGEGAEREPLQQQINGNGLQDVVHLCGRTDNVAAEYARHSVLIMSSRYEGFGLVLVEAAICGLPLISFNCQSGPSEIIQEGYNGTLVKKVGDVDRLAQAIIKYTSSEELRRRTGRHAKESSSRFNLETIINKWIKELDTLIAQ